MYDIPRLRPTNKETAVAILIVTVLLVVIFCAGYMLGIRNAGTGKTDGDGGNSGAGQVGQHIQSAATNQREITERIDGLQNSTAQVSNRITESAAGIENAAAANSRAEVLVRESGELIAEGQQILRRIRSRAEKDPASR